MLKNYRSLSMDLSNDFGLARPDQTGKLESNTLYAESNFVKLKWMAVYTYEPKIAVTLLIGAKFEHVADKRHLPMSEPDQDTVIIDATLNVITDDKSENIKRHQDSDDEKNTDDTHRRDCFPTWIHCTPP